jgi:hypothetical protein
MSYGFDLEEVTVKPGAKRLVIRNCTGIRENLTFVVDRPGQPALLSGSAETGNVVSDIVPFTPGDMTITEVSHPEWICTVHVEP